jgi:hypothetical protein
MSASSAIIYILYNANGSILGKVKYGYEKICAPRDGPSPCAACDLTHGGLKLSESEQWKQTEKQIPAKVVKLHLDELDPEVSIRNSPYSLLQLTCNQLRDYIKTNVLSTPVVLARSNGPLQALLLSEELEKLKKDHEGFLSMLFSRAGEKGIALDTPPQYMRHA